ncbi:hypothetical protein EDC96DRAFT_568421 [Choanephora cucurbitarum]|nr:hypothetical protein EDC96DRAFT_568421 [Choanephora cucurbitarum]
MLNFEQLQSLQFVITLLTIVLVFAKIMLILLNSGKEKVFGANSTGSYMLWSNRVLERLFSLFFIHFAFENSFSELTMSNIKLFIVLVHLLLTIPKDQDWLYQKKEQQSHVIINLMLRYKCLEIDDGDYRIKQESQLGLTQELELTRSAVR